MHRADKAVLRLGMGLGLAVLIAYGLALPGAFVVCALTVLFLCNPGPPVPFVKGAVLGAVVAVLLTAGVLMVPLLEHYRVAGVLLTATLLYAVFLAGARKASPLTIFLVMALAVIPVAGVAEQGLTTVLGVAVGLGVGIGVLVNGISHVFFPDAPAPSATPRPPAATDPAAPRWKALQATLVVMPVFVLALTNPALYLAAIMKTVALGQQVGATTARSAGRELVGSTVVGALMATVVWCGLSLRPTLWMLMLWTVAAAMWAGVRLFRIKRVSTPPSFWLNALITMIILLGPAIEDASVGKDVYAASAFRVALFVAVALYASATVWVLERWRAGHAHRRARRPGAGYDGTAAA